MTRGITRSSLSIAGPPDPPKNCSLTNQTQDSLQVDCREGFSSGLKQEFHMEVFTHPGHQLLVNITARSPRLLARGLPDDSSLFLRVYASTVKGRSRSVTFDGYTLRRIAESSGEWLKEKALGSADFLCSSLPQFSSHDDAF